MDMIVNSLYSNRDVFLRELVSNASDALDKIRFLGLSDEKALAAGSDLQISIKADPEAKTITIECAPFKIARKMRSCSEVTSLY